MAAEPGRPVARPRVRYRRRLVARGSATAPQPAFEIREVGGVIQACLPGAG